MRWRWSMGSFRGASKNQGWCHNWWFCCGRFLQRKAKVWHYFLGTHVEFGASLRIMWFHSAQHWYGKHYHCHICFFKCMEGIYANSHFLHFITKQYVLTCGIECQQTWTVVVSCCFCCRSLRRVLLNRPKVALDLEHQYKVDSTVTWWADSHQQRRYGADKEKVVFRSQNLNMKWWVFIATINAESSPLPRCICQSLWHCVSFWCVFFVIIVTKLKTNWWWWRFQILYGFGKGTGNGRCWGRY